MSYRPCPCPDASGIPARRRWWPLALLLAGCATTSFNHATGRQETLFISDEREISIGDAVARQVRKDLPPVEDAMLQERVRAIGDRLATISDRRGLIYHFEALQDPKDAPRPVINAFALPGGYVFVQEGLLRIAQTDDELAAVMAHELGHVTARHAIKRFQASLGTGLLHLIALGAVRDARVGRGVTLASQQVFLAHAREDELEADRLGAKYLQAAGFAPEAMVRVLQRLQEEHRQEPPRPMGTPLVRPNYAMTHPYIPDRLRVVKEAIYGRADFVDYINTSE